MQLNPYLAVVVVTAGLYGAFLATRPEPTTTTAAPDHARPVTPAGASSPSPTRTVSSPTRQTTAPRPVAYRWTDEDGRTHYGEAPGDPAAVPVHGAISIYPAAELPRRHTSSSTTARPTPSRPAVRTASTAPSEERAAARKAAACAKAKADLDYVRSRMRAGYRASEANYLNELERDARERRNKNC